MKFCTTCGAEINDEAVICVKCGHQVGKENTRSASNEDLSEAWKLKFKLIDKAGGPKLSHARELPFSELMKISFNIWGFLLGPIYYLAKGMWKKAIVLLGLCIVAILIIDIIFKNTGIPDSITYLISPVVFAARANIDYYKKMVSDENGWW